MNKIITYIIWPAIAGLVFALILLQMPRALQSVPGLSDYFPTQAPTIVQQVQTITTPVSSYSSAIKKAAPAMVSISSQQDILRIEEDVQSESNNLGSGIIISPDGFIITSYHIFYTPDSLRLRENTTITMPDGRTLAARPVMLDQDNDLALLKINAENLPFLNPAPEDNLEVGDIVLAIGNPRNIGMSASMGIVSAKLGREDSYLIQHDAAINPGNSGGALIDVDGNLIGINSTIISESGGSEGIGLAVPVSKAIELIQTYIENGPSGYLGVDSEPLTILGGLERFDRVVQGLLINSITEDSPAEIAGLLIGDLIIAVNNQRLSVTNDRDTSAILSITGYGAGETVLLEILRNSETLQLPVTLGVGEPIVYMVLGDKILDASPDAQFPELPSLSADN